ncbi:MAG TPA: hypothetical protein VFG72_04310 [Marmoricola sp.]|nr:hypothetical protein [Marmoricola sp.]
MDVMDRAGIQAEAMFREVQERGSLEPVYASLEDALMELEASGGSLDDVLPGGDEEALGVKAMCGGTGSEEPTESDAR